MLIVHIVHSDNDDDDNNNNNSLLNCYFTVSNVVHTDAVLIKLASIHEVFHYL